MAHGFAKTALTGFGRSACGKVPACVMTGAKRGLHSAFLGPTGTNCGHRLRERGVRDLYAVREGNESRPQALREPTQLVVVIRTESLYSSHFGLKTGQSLHAGRSSAAGTQKRH
ncbi:hypothetical protein CC1G_14257 [Coprinopsis cinerea okayama7|uniref:Uncharacterized protein n=1 Tax=Coprinopsis cinerea (strain Okayama-7 / 130 / ATCC MYA-4618 / FGSC 9003) TaxID=240176 RepID=D6RLE8_COPC7|nr:hypothetical protein CC1G_14257 [Coprinopsis cinerea okayama7\|eukprot:XP_002911726.1 hypothetical protein CC1G_14257 [Coprinopsis cinerea okayama7\